MTTIKYYLQCSPWLAHVNLLASCAPRTLRFRGTSSWRTPFGYIYDEHRDVGFIPGPVWPQYIHLSPDTRHLYVRLSGTERGALRVIHTKNKNLPVRLGQTPPTPTGMANRRPPANRDHTVLSIYLVIELAQEVSTRFHRRVIATEVHFNYLAAPSAVLLTSTTVAAVRVSSSHRQILNLILESEDSEEFKYPSAHKPLTPSFWTPTPQLDELFAIRTSIKSQVRQTEQAASANLNMPHHSCAFIRTTTISPTRRPSTRCANGPADPQGLIAAASSHGKKRAVQLLTDRGDAGNHVVRCRRPLVAHFFRRPEAVQRQYGSSLKLPSVVLRATWDLSPQFRTRATEPKGRVSIAWLSASSSYGITLKR
ncbi:hypothetical protein GGX14DRAFT_596599 [Mycena pura]|uniref:Uncharacterized protein n=1 Tax=Mycena pura TaxID=153505 RepID=A0AAD6Y2Y9_9AGAR|nr:hypothetical protein GGX14DRAFT_596599 [Mycena pura]